MKKKQPFIQKIYLFLIMLFLYFPIGAIAFFSFNSTSSTYTFSGFSLQWYQSLLHDEVAMDALKNTLVLAVVCAIVSTLLGTVASVGIFLMKNKHLKRATMTVTNIPMMNPEIVTGVSMMLLFVFAGTLVHKSSSLGFGTLLIAHITFSLPYVILSVLPKLRQFDTNIFEAAMDLGCKPFGAFMNVVLPDITSGIITGAIMSFTLSLDDFIISYFTNGPSFQTLPIYIFSMTKKIVKPDMYALSTIIFLTILLLLVLLNIGTAAQEKRRNKN